MIVVSRRRFNKVGFTLSASLVATTTGLSSLAMANSSDKKAVYSALNRCARRLLDIWFRKPADSASLIDEIFAELDKVAPVGSVWMFHTRQAMLMGVRPETPTAAVQTGLTRHGPSSGQGLAPLLGYPKLIQADTSPLRKFGVVDNAHIRIMAGEGASNWRLVVALTNRVPDMSPATLGYWHSGEGWEFATGQ